MDSLNQTLAARAPAGVAALTGPGGAHLRVADWMTTPVQTIQTNTPVLDAYTTMSDGAIRHLPVVEGDRLVGIVTQTDCQAVHATLITDGRTSGGPTPLALLTVGQIMTAHPLTVTPDTAIAVAARLMLERKIRSLPVVDRGGRLIGIITESDLLRLLSRLAV